MTERELMAVELSTTSSPYFKCLAEIHEHHRMIYSTTQSDSLTRNDPAFLPYTYSDAPYG
jgi:hypothetical protein